MQWPFPALRSGHEASGPLHARRQGANNLFQGFPDSNRVTFTETTLGDVACVILDVTEPIATLIYFHGGGYRLGRAASWSSFCLAIAERANVRIVIVDYALAPEHPFPAALHDAAAVYLAVIEGDSLPLFLGGDSAGGGLAASLANASASLAHQQPNGVILLSPWVDLTLSSASFLTNAERDQFFPLLSAEEAAESYLQGANPADPLVSPIYGDLSLFPPALIFAGGDETLLDDGLRLRASLEEHGIDVTAYFPDGMQHVWPTLFPDLDESKIAVDEIIDFLLRFS